MGKPYEPGMVTLARQRDGWINVLDRSGTLTHEVARPDPGIRQAIRLALGYSNAVSLRARVVAGTPTARISMKEVVKPPPRWYNRRWVRFIASEAAKGVATEGVKWVAGRFIGFFREVFRVGHAPQPTQ